LPIAYEFKTEELFGALGMGDLVTHIDDASEAVLCRAFDQLVERLESQRGELFERVLRLRSGALRVADLVPSDPRREADVRAALAPIAETVRRDRLTYLSDRKFLHIQRCLDDLEREKVEGDRLEAGVALGGSAIVIAALMGPRRRFVGYDVFGMIPPPGERDDEKSHRRYQTIESGASRGIGGDAHYGYRDTLYDDVVAAFAAHGLAVDGDRIALVRGLFADTMDLADRRIAFAHIDCDWYDPVALCLDRIYAALVPGGYVISDDYHDYGGCRDAVDGFLVAHDDMLVVSREGSVVMRRARA
jgi:asparagine synthase (glutamine-hydrolysing)